MKSRPPNSFNAIAKRSFDIVASAASLVALAPLLLIVGLAIKLSSKGPVFFRQIRVGRAFRPFTILKFRTMRHESQGPAITIGGDTRVTRLGRLLRFTKIDELPQLVNVLRGDMSLVGPRPELPQYVDLFRADYVEILSVRPGITDFASFQYRDEEVILARSADPEWEYIEVILPIKVELGKRYVRRAGLAFDLGIILKTVLELVWHRTNRLRSGLLHIRRPLVVIIHLTMAGASYYLAWWFRFDGQIPLHERGVLFAMFPLVLIVRAASLYFFRLYQGLWRFTDIWDVEKIFLGAVFGQLVLVVIVRLIFGLQEFPRAVFLLDAMLFMFSMVAARLVWRGYVGLGQFEPNLRTLIVGPPASAALLAHAVRTYSTTDRRVVGLVNVNREHVGLHIHGVPVLGSIAGLEQVLRRAAPDEVLVVGDLDDTNHRLIVEAAAVYGVTVRNAPDLTLIMADPSIREPSPARLPSEDPHRAASPKAAPGSSSVIPYNDGQRCPHCAEYAAMRIRAVTLWERAHRALTEKHLFRCDNCRRRFWSDMTPPRSEPIEVRPVDLIALDNALQNRPNPRPKG